MNESVLIVDDHPPSIFMLEAMLQPIPIGRILCCHDSRNVPKLLAGEEVSAVLLDLRMPHVSGEQLLELIVRDYKDIPAIVVTSDDDIETAVRCMRGGAFDYVVKPVDKNRLTVSVKNALLVRSLLNENRNIREQARRQIAQLSYYDTLTGLPNRELIRQLLKQAVAQAERRGNELAVLCLDVDHFKRVNDTLGHFAGDQLLNDLAARLVSCVRCGDLVLGLTGEDQLSSWEGCNAVGRVGSDEFVVLLTDIDDPANAATVAERINEALRAPFVINDTSVCIASSIGISHFPSDSADSATLLRNAEAAMHHVKTGSRNTYQYYVDGLNGYAQKRLALENSLRQGLEHKQFVLHYQPRIDVASGAVVGAEALVRWQHPEQGLIPPNQFIPVAEESGLIVPLGQWVLQTACEQLRAWDAAGLPPLRVSVNLSAVQFVKKDLAADIAAILRDTGIDPKQLELELTETMLMENFDEITRQLSELKALGVTLAIDDFGTGYSSLNYLKRFPLDVLKIDQSFVADIGASSQDDAIVDVIIAMGRSLKLKVIGEGVEHEHQLHFLHQHGCDEAQGYLLSEPLPTPQFLEFFRRAA